MSERSPAKSCCSCVCHNAVDNPTQLLVNLLHTSNQLTAAITEVARVQAHAVLSVVQRESADPGRTLPSLVTPQTNDTTPQTNDTPIPAANEFPTGMIISERVGSISVAQWIRMSNDNLNDLDAALNRIVSKTMIQDGEWDKTGIIIQAELAAVGFVFKAESELSEVNGTRDWELAENTGLPGMMRMRAAASAARSDLGSVWWADEMVRIVVRLMELRGME